jgi:phosphatidylglycerol:prolipoprotein diacylglycerol transferase
MNPITFPGLGLSVQIDRVAFSILGKDIYWYGIILALGFLAGSFVASKQYARLGGKEDDALDMLLYAAPTAILCARIYYVVFYLDLYRNSDGSFNWREAIAIWDGGIAVYGSIMGAVLAAYIYCRIRKLSFLTMADAFAFGLPLGQAIGRWGNFVNQEAYGGECTLPWRMGLTVGNGNSIEVHPTFLYESLWNLVGLALLFLVIRQHRKFNGMLFCFYLFWYGLGRVWIEGMRTDSLYLFSTGIRVSQMVALVCVVAAGGVLLWQLLISRGIKNTEKK